MNKKYNTNLRLRTRGVFLPQILIIIAIKMKTPRTRKITVYQYLIKNLFKLAEKKTIKKCSLKYVCNLNSTIYM